MAPKMGKRPPRKSGPQKPIRKSRKEIRKEQRKEKKLKRSMKYHWKTAQTNGTNKQEISDNNKAELKLTSVSKPKNPRREKQPEDVMNREKLKVKKLQSDMQNRRKKQLLAANEEEDRNIKKLEKLLKLNKRKSKSMPKSFVEDGLGYLLEVCDPDKMKDSAKVDQVLQDSGSEFEEDFAVARGQEPKKEKKKVKIRAEKEREDISDLENFDDSGSDFGLGVDDGSDEEMSGTDELDNEDQNSDKSGEYLSDEDQSMDDADSIDDPMSEGEFESDDGDLSSDGNNTNVDIPEKGLKKNNKTAGSKKVRFETTPAKHVGKGELKSNEDFDEDLSNEDEEVPDKETASDDKKDMLVGAEKQTKNPDGTWQDIYGRMRDKDGNVVEEKTTKYVPPALRAKMQGDKDVKRQENLSRLRRQMKGLINRLAENNMASICNQMDELFMKNSRNDMNETLLSLFTDALVSKSLTPERLILEHMLLVSVLHANVGTEIGAFFLQNMMKNFHRMLESSLEVENKELDNVVLILSHLYNFKVFSASLMYEVLDKIAEKLDEKRIELLLVVLRSVGFSLRKDDPLALKSLILKLQSKVSSSSTADSSSSRVKFMLDILMAVKNNNMSKIPSYNPEQSEHLKKLLRSLVRRGNYIAELKISLEDLLKADERGRWWIVGSAWSGHLPGENPSANSTLQPIQLGKATNVSDTSYSTQLLELARKQRMNTGVRKDIFCILMTAEDYLDAFEKLLHLNLKNQQRQEIVNVLFDCCLQEKSFNPYYAHLSLKFCDFDRQYQMKFQYCLWDKLKELEKFGSSQLSNLAKLLAHLFLEKGLALSALKVISFAEMDKPCVRLVRQILLAILLSSDVSKCEAVFLRIAPSPKLHLFREGLRLFINHFVLRKSSTKTLPKEELELLQSRAKVAEKALSLADSKTEF